MRMIVDISRGIFNRAQAMIEQGHYTSLNEAIRVALETQLTLDETPDGPIVSATGIARKQSTRLRSQRFGRSSRATGHEPRRAGGRGEETEQVDPELPDLLRAPTETVITPAEMPDVSAVSDRKYWLWGINRVAPIKTACRILAVLAAGDGGTIGIDRLRELGGPMARQVGDYLVAQDDAGGRKHGNRLSSGFPRSGEDDVASQKSSERFCDFFFGSVRKRTSRVDGALYELRLAMIQPRENAPATIGPTAAGLEFARVRSPMLDGPPGSLDRALSEEEARWYLGHVKSHVPQEYEMLVRSMRYIRDGRGGTEQFLEAMSCDYPSLSEKARSSLRVCILGRLLDIGCVTRHEEGNYGLTHAGSAALG